MSWLFKQLENKTRFQKSNILTFCTVDVGNGAGGDVEQENPSVKPSKRSFSLIGCHWKEKKEDYKSLHLLKSKQTTQPAHF